MPFIYEPKGRAREYAELACNLFVGSCPFGCKYCFTRQMPFHYANIRQRTRPGLLEGIRKEAPKYAGREVHLCFTCDPFSLTFDASEVLMPAMDALLDAGCSVSLLTKAGAPETPRVLRLYAGQNTVGRIRYGATLTHVHPAESIDWEPGAALPDARTRALREIHDMGFKTWVSFEPVIYPDATLELMRRVAPYVDLYKIGRWNHCSSADAIDWRTFGRNARGLCKRLGKPYVLKRDLLVALGEVDREG